MNDIELTCVDTRHLESTLIDSVPKLKEEV